MVDDKPGGKVFDIYQRGRVTQPMVHVLSLINDVGDLAAKGEQHGGTGSSLVRQARADNEAHGMPWEI